MSISNWPRWYKPHCRECAWCKTNGEVAWCDDGKWPDLWSVNNHHIDLADIDSPPYYASRCRQYEPMDLEPDGSPIPGAEYDFIQGHTHRLKRLGQHIAGYEIGTLCDFKKTPKSSKRSSDDGDDDGDA